MNSKYGVWIKVPPNGIDPRFFIKRDPLEEQRLSNILQLNLLDIKNRGVIKDE